MEPEKSTVVAPIESTDAWKIVDDTTYPASIRCGDELIAEFPVWGWTEKRNAKFIVAAKNSHNILLNAFHKIAAQSVTEDWTETKALCFIIRHARVELALLKGGHNAEQRYQAGCHYAAGITAYTEGHDRVLPTYFVNSQNVNARAWLSGWDFAKSADIPDTQDLIKLEHTPTPWSVGLGGSCYYPLGVFADDEAMLVAFHSFDVNRNKKAHLITRVCNSFELLVSTLVDIADIRFYQISTPKVVLDDVIALARNCLREASGTTHQ